jgi:hypothetical protein
MRYWAAADVHFLGNCALQERWHYTIIDAPGEQLWHMLRLQMKGLANTACVLGMKHACVARNWKAAFWDSERPSQGCC